MTWLLVGATGTSGRRIVAEALRRGHRPVLAGRDHVALAGLAARHGLEHVVTDLADEAATVRMLAGHELLLNAAGPFAATAGPLAHAAIASRTAYLDISNEPRVHRVLYDLNDAARRAGVVVLPGVGFGVVATDCLALHVVRRLPAATAVEVAVRPLVGETTRGVLATALELLPAGALELVDGVPTTRPPGRSALVVDFGDGPVRAGASVTADLLAVHRCTAVTTIGVFSTEVPSSRVAAALLPATSRLLGLSPVHDMASRVLGRRSLRRPMDGRAPGGRSSAWARARSADGATVEARLDLDEGYAFTAAASVRAVEEVLAGQLVGAHTPAQAFGADFVLSVGDTSRCTTTASATWTDGPRPVRR